MSKGGDEFYLNKIFKYNKIDAGRLMIKLNDFFSDSRHVHSSYPKKWGEIKQLLNYIWIRIFNLPILPIRFFCIWNKMWCLNSQQRVPFYKGCYQSNTRLESYFSRLFLHLFLSNSLQSFSFNNSLHNLQLISYEMGNLAKYPKQIKCNLFFDMQNGF